MANFDSQYLKNVSSNTTILKTYNYSVLFIILVYWIIFVKSSVLKCYILWPTWVKIE